MAKKLPSTTVAAVWKNQKESHTAAKVGTMKAVK
jgi:hypothetical protein